VRFSSAAESRSRYTVAAACVCRIEDGWSGLRDQSPDPAALRDRVRRVAREKVEGARLHAIDDPIAQVAPEARGVAVADPDVLVEVEDGDPAPLDARRRRERVQELELRRPGGRDHPRFTGARDRAAGALWFAMAIAVSLPWSIRACVLHPYRAFTSVHSRS
jgi:hypothetical protein